MTRTSDLDANRVPSRARLARRRSHALAADILLLVYKCAVRFGKALFSVERLRDIAARTSTLAAGSDRRQRRRPCARRRASSSPDPTRLVPDCSTRLSASCPRAPSRRSRARARHVARSCGARRAALIVRKATRARRPRAGRASPLAVLGTAATPTARRRAGCRGRMRSGRRCLALRPAIPSRHVAARRGPPRLRPSAAPGSGSTATAARPGCARSSAATTDGAGCPAAFQHVVHVLVLNRLAPTRDAVLEAEQDRHGAALVEAAPPDPPSPQLKIKRPGALLDRLLTRRLRRRSMRFLPLGPRGSPASSTTLAGVAPSMGTKANSDGPIRQPPPPSGAMGARQTGAAPTGIPATRSRGAPLPATRRETSRLMLRAGVLQAGRVLAAGSGPARAGRRRRAPRRQRARERRRGAKYDSMPPSGRGAANPPSAARAGGQGRQAAAGRPGVPCC